MRTSSSAEKSPEAAPSSRTESALRMPVKGVLSSCEMRERRLAWKARKSVSSCGDKVAGGLCPTDSASTMAFPKSAGCGFLAVCGFLEGEFFEIRRIFDLEFDEPAFFKRVLSDHIGFILSRFVQLVNDSRGRGNQLHLPVGAFDGDDDIALFEIVALIWKLDPFDG